VNVTPALACQASVLDSGMMVHAGVLYSPVLSKPAYCDKPVVFDVENVFHSKPNLFLIKTQKASLYWYMIS
jgi:hypothetical protein